MKRELGKKLRLLICMTIAMALFSGCITDEVLDTEEPAPSSMAEDNSDDLVYVFGVGYVESGDFAPRGGSSRGSDVTLSPAQEMPLQSISGAPDSFEKDRNAILSLAGDYKVSFHFLETLGFDVDHELGRPYHSWATEKVNIIEETDTFISLQHTLVMYFKDEDGNVGEPMLVKHWRQDWTYEDTDLHAFKGKNTWERQTFDEDEVAGKWSQSVWQVDDSPRYAVQGKWTHDGNRSVWTSDSFWRPLPRREYSVRDDYNVMEGFNRIVITPTGWVHEQNNWKRVAGEDAEASYRGHEIGINRYMRIISPSLAKADEYWNKTSSYWNAVRARWKELYETHERISLHSKVDDTRQYESHFEYAGRLYDDDLEGIEDPEEFAASVIEKYIVKDSADSSSSY